MSEAEPHFVEAHLHPASWEVQCPTCGVGVEVPDVEEDDAGVWHGAREHCVVSCEDCGAVIAVLGCNVTPVSDPPWRNRF
jgi:hypothetical protein